VTAKHLGYAISARSTVTLSGTSSSARCIFLRHFGARADVCPRMTSRVMIPSKCDMRDAPKEWCHATAHGVPQPTVLAAYGFCPALAGGCVRASPATVVARQQRTSPRSRRQASGCGAPQTDLLAPASALWTILGATDSTACAPLRARSRIARWQWAVPWLLRDEINAQPAAPLIGERGVRC
jgi:hypothetical protein